MNRSPLEAYNSLMRFARDRGEWPLRLAMHAAVPRSFQLQFLQAVKKEFLPEFTADDPTIERAVLLAPFCDGIGAGYYQFDPQVRALLVDNLQSTYSGSRLRMVAEWLLIYLDQHRHSSGPGDRLLQGYLNIERSAALAIIRGSHAK